MLLRAGRDDVAACGQRRCCCVRAETVLLRVMLRIVVHHKTNVSHDHMRQPVHTRVKLVVCCTLHAWWLHTSHYRAPTAIFLVSL